jgi:hypothetical protein
MKLKRVFAEGNLAATMKCFNIIVFKIQSNTEQDLKIIACEIGSKNASIVFQENLH